MRTSVTTARLARLDVAHDGTGVDQRAGDDLVGAARRGETLGSGMRRVDERALAQIEPLQLGRRVAAVEARQRARVTLADQQPVRVEALELAGVVDVGDRNDRARAASECVGCQRRTRGRRR